MSLRRQDVQNRKLHDIDSNEVFGVFAVLDFDENVNFLVELDDLRNLVLFHAKLAH